MNFKSKKKLFFIAAFVACILLSTSSNNVMGLTTVAEKNNVQLPISELRLKSLAYRAIVLASNVLANDRKDKRGLLLIDFAKSFIPKDKDLLLLRGRIKFNLPIKPIKSKRTVTEESFVENLRTTIKDMPRDTRTITRHLKLMFYGFIRLFKPEDEDAIIALVAYEDMGYNVDLSTILTESLVSKSKIVYDPKDPRYVISNIRKTVPVAASEPWTDSRIKVKKGKIIRVNSSGLWSMGDGPYPSCDGDGFIDWLPPTKSSKTNKNINKVDKQFNPGQLVARIGKKVYSIGASGTFRAEDSGILEFGPYEWDNYNNNTGRLLVTIEVSDR
ncbi:hypothetical protein AAEX28_08200 [Lentisphaerota bacterium WC36G]|nr:hypothetical protein LJT99_11055 [Lentisphaerae bacterium WC36]